MTVFLRRNADEVPEVVPSAISAPKAAVSTVATLEVVGAPSNFPLRLWRGVRALNLYDHYIPLHIGVAIGMILMASAHPLSAFVAREVSSLHDAWQNAHMPPIPLAKVHVDVTFPALPLQQAHASPAPAASLMVLSLSDLAQTGGPAVGQRQAPSVGSLRYQPQTDTHSAFAPPSPPVLVRVIGRSAAARPSVAPSPPPSRTADSPQSDAPGTQTVAYQAPGVEATVAPVPASASTPAAAPAPPPNYNIVAVPTSSLVLVATTIQGQKQVSPYKLGDALPDGRIITALDPAGGTVSTATGDLHITQ
jgi:hypothetical protein